MSKRCSKSYRDDHRIGGLVEVVKQIYKMILDDQWLKLPELAEVTDITKSGIHCILKKFDNDKTVFKIGAAFAH